MTQVSRAQFTVSHFSLEAKHYSFSLISSVILLFWHTCILIHFFLKKRFILYVYMFGCVQVPQRPEEGVGLPGVGVTGSVSLLTWVPVAELSSSG